MSRVFVHNDIDPERFLAIATPLLEYCAETGLFYWRQTFRGEGRVLAGRIGKRHQYVGITLLGETFHAHRLAWIFHYGEWPKQYVDHINGIRSDNRIDNLRDVSQSENNCNRYRPRRDNPGLPMGVQRVGSKFRAKIRLDGRQVYLGTFATPSEAGSAFDEAVRKNRSALAATNERLGLL